MKKQPPRREPTEQGKSIATKVPEQLHNDFLAAVEYYHIPTGAAFVTMCCQALVEAHKNEERLPLPLAFETIKKSKE